jgi:hypothetical protein
VQVTVYSRRLTSRLVVPEDLWVYWECEGYEDVSRVRNLGLGGLYVETSMFRPPGIFAALNFLVREGQIRTEAIVCHTVTSSGIGLRFVAVQKADWPNLVALLSRLRSLAE